MGRLEAVLSTIRRARELGFWLEIVTLIVPAMNDSDDELTRIADFIAGVSEEIPWHVTAFRPTYKAGDTPRTPAETLERAHALGAGSGTEVCIRWQPGGTSGRIGEQTHCPGCGRTLIIPGRVSSNTQ